VWQRLIGCFQSYEQEDMAERGWSAPEGHDQLNFGGRRRPAMIDTKLAALWLHDCFTKPWRCLRRNAIKRRGVG